MAQWIVGLTLRDVPADVVSLARAQQIDILASLYAGTRTALGLRLLASMKDISEEGPVLTFPDGRPRSLFSGLYLQAVLANVLELDNFVFAGHTGQSAVMVPLCLGQVTGASGEDALLAQIIANEVAGRLGAVMTAGPQHGHMKAYLHRAAAASAASRLLGYDESATTLSLAIALAAPEYPLFPASFSPDTKALCVGEPTVGGVRAAYLAGQA
ncbi:MAG: MmgE/PrpD family protein, partial [Candidatus Neomarinimicrobiota bacterium]